MVEAKRNDFEQGWGQCLAEFVAADRLNSHSLAVYGIVTDGKPWEFGRLHNQIFTKNSASTTRRKSIYHPDLPSSPSPFFQVCPLRKSRENLYLKKNFRLQLHLNQLRVLGLFRSQSGAELIFLCLNP